MGCLASLRPPTRPFIHPAPVHPSIHPAFVHPSIHPTSTAGALCAGTGALGTHRIGVVAGLPWQRGSPSFQTWDSLGSGPPEAPLEG